MNKVHVKTSARVVSILHLHNNKGNKKELCLSILA